VPIAKCVPLRKGRRAVPGANSPERESRSPRRSYRSVI
jgi:hypothetical protein